MLELSSDAIGIGVVARDGETMMRYYEETLGLNRFATIVIPGVGTLNQFKVGAGIFKVLVPEGSPPAAGVPGVPWEATGMRYWTIYVPDLDALLATCATAGCVPLTGIVAPRPGIRYALVPDPEGNVLEIIETEHLPT
jgi:predicted enzyme related to lactoylglutathione lyase